jgi:hypothetical protein
MKKQIKKVIQISGNYTNETTEVIAKITSLCRKYKISIDDMQMDTFGQEKYYAKIFSSFLPGEEHIFWDELAEISVNSGIDLNMIIKEEYYSGFTDYSR